MSFAYILAFLYMCDVKYIRNTFKIASQISLNPVEITEKSENKG